jgi:hypothetical protein
MTCAPFFSYSFFGMIGELWIALFTSIFSIEVPYTFVNVPYKSVNAPYSSTLIRPSPANQFVYTELAFGSQAFNIGVDTGSSDTWVVSSDFTCMINNASHVQKDCHVGRLYNFDGNFTQAPDEQLYAWYEPMVATGLPGFAPVTVAGLTVTAKVSVVTTLVNVCLCLLSLTNSWQHDPGTGMSSIASGLLGLAFSPITSIAPADAPWSPNSTHVPSKSIMTYIFESMQVPHKFSLALSRGAEGSNDGGIFTIGGLPDLDDPRVNATNEFASVPLEGAVDWNPKTKVAWYMITVQGLYYGSLGNKTVNTEAAQYVVDNGGATLDLPQRDTENWLSMFNPYMPPKNQTGYREVYCNATFPALDLRIGGKLFPMNPADLVVQIGGKCYSKVGSSTAPPYYLGDAFHRSVLAVYDWDNQQMQCVYPLSPPTSL